VKIDDELLVAYADGELDTQEARRVAHAIEADPVLQARLSALTEAAELTRALFEAKAHEPVPDTLVDAIYGAAPQPAPAARVGQAGWWDRLIDWWRLPLPATAFAAFALLAVGGLVGYLLPQDGRPGDSIVTAGMVPAGSVLGRVLDEQPGGGVLDSGDLQIEAVATFVADDRVCREYRATAVAPRHEYHAGIACLRSDGAWHVAFAVNEYLEREPVGGFYETASDKLHEAIDAFIDEDLGVDPLRDGDEASLLENGWRLR
jgi:hypothetical protein